MSKKTNAAKLARSRRQHAPRRKNKGLRRNPAANGLLSEAALSGVVEDLAFGTVGCAILRAFGVKPIDVLKRGIEIVSERDGEEPKA